MDEGIKVFVALDVHKDSIVIGAAQAGSRVPARQVGRTAHEVNKLLKALAKLGAPSEVHGVYEAGPTGYGLQRALAARGYRCQVIAPSLIPRRAGERIKTDGRDCLKLAESSRSGDLRAVWVPDPAHEAIRDLSRARDDAVTARTQGAPSASIVPAAPRSALSPQDRLDRGVSSLAGDAELRPRRGPDGLH